MTPWLVALGAGLTFAALQYGRLVAREGPASLALAGLRATAVTLLVALLLDARAGPETLPAPLVALDASQSWTRGDTTRWAQAWARARTLGGDSLLLIGDSVRFAGDAAAPRDTRSSLASLAEQAAAQGRPLVLVSDGELPAADARIIEGLPRGSRIEVLPAPRLRDVAVTRLDAPQSIPSGDTLRAVVTLQSGSAPVPASTLTLRLDDAVLATQQVPGFGAFAARDVQVAVRIPGGDGSRTLRAIISAAEDAETRNDTLAAGLDVSAATSAVWISAAPDLDGRAALAVLRGALAVPTRAFLRVAPGTWRIEGTLEPVAEATVRQAAEGAAMLVVHGDTAVFGPPRALAGSAPLALLPGPGTGAPSGPAALDEWYPSIAPPSPASAAISGIPWDSLPPVSLGDAAMMPAPSGANAWVALAGRRGRRGDARPFVVGLETGSMRGRAGAPRVGPVRRVVVSRATGMWRWHARGGTGAVAYSGLWGALFDWLADARRDRRAAMPAQGGVRAGEPIAWRVSAAADSGTQVRLVRRDDPSRARVLTLVPGAGTIMASSQPLEAGIYDVETTGGRSIVAVNAAEELLPRAPTVRDGAVGRGPVAGSAPALRDLGIAYAAVVALLCIEWVLRRRRGLH